MLFKHLVVTLFYRHTPASLPLVRRQNQFLMLCEMVITINAPIKLMRPAYGHTSFPHSIVSLPLGNTKEVS